MEKTFYIAYADHLEYESHTLFVADTRLSIFSASIKDAVLFTDELLALDYATGIENVLGNTYIGRTKEINIL